MERHPAIDVKMSYFSYEHLPEGPLREVSARCFNLAHTMYLDERLQGEQLTLGLQKLIEAKDCFVRAALPK